MPDMVLKKFLRPALVRAGITGKVIGRHSFRHYAGRPDEQMVSEAQLTG
jgi:hypothetical protein